MDPFCGSGTVLVEAVLAGRPAIGCDTNPLAVLLTKVKTTPLEPERIHTALSRLTHRLPRRTRAQLPHLVDVGFWHPRRVVSQLLRLKGAIAGTRDAGVRDYFWACFSVVVRRGSVADPRLSVPVRLNPDRFDSTHWYCKLAKDHLKRLETFDAMSEFVEVVRCNATKMNTIATRAPVRCSVLLQDARTVTIADTAKPALIVTSPPYLGAQKYIRASSLALAWLDLAPDKTLRELEDENIGREHFAKKLIIDHFNTGDEHADKLLKKIRAINPLRAHLAATYLSEMSEALRNSIRHLKPRGQLVLVAGDNTLCGHLFRTSAYLRRMCEQAGCETRLHLVDEIRARGLITKRHHTASTISHEHIFVMQRMS